MHATRIALLLALVIAPAIVRAGEPIPVFINCRDAVGIPGGTANVEVALVPGDALVVGTQNDLGFDGAFGITRGECFINPAIGPGTEANKELQQNILTDPPRVRGIVVSLDSFGAIPEGLLYTCPFRVPADMPEGNYPITNDHAVASNAEGMQLPVSAGNCQIVVAAATPTATPTPRCRENEDCPDGQVCVDGECVTPTPSPTPTGCSNNDDCPDGQVCVNNHCVTPTPTPTGCTNNDDCPDGQVCVNNHCVTPTPTPRCRTNNDCPDGQVCVDGMCEQATPTATPTTTVHVGGGGGGCNCEIDPNAGAWETSHLLAMLLPALVLILRWRAGRAAR